MNFTDYRHVHDEKRKSNCYLDNQPTLYNSAGFKEEETHTKKKKKKKKKTMRKSTFLSWAVGSAVII